MICSSCHKDARHIRSIILRGKIIDICEHCGGFSVASGTRADGLLTRNRFSIRSEATKNEADFIQPHEYSKSAHRLVPNRKFIERHSKSVGEYFTQDDLDKSGYNKLKINKKLDPGVEHHGNASEKIKEILKK